MSRDKRAIIPLTEEELESWKKAAEQAGFSTLAAFVRHCISLTIMVFDQTDKGVAVVIRDDDEEMAPYAYE